MAMSAFMYRLAGAGDVPDVTVSKVTSATEVAAGTTYTYTVTVDNLGPEAAEDVVVTDDVASGLDVVSAVWPSGSCIVDDSNLVECAVGALAAGETAAITIEVVHAGGSCSVDVDNQASVVAGNEAAAQQGNNGSEIVTVTVADVGACGDDGSLREAPDGGALGTTSTFAAGAALYTGDSPRQVVPDPTVFAPARAGIASGRVLDRDGAGIPGVRVAVLGEDGVGHTETQADGTWDMAVNGGGQLTFDFTADGLLPVQRTISMEWQDWAVLDDVVMIAVDPAVTTIDLAGLGGGEVAVHSGTTVSDGDGTRTPHLLFTGGTTAEVHDAGGSTTPLSSIDVRVTEYTVGEDGPAAMPGELPPASAYTYAAEFSVDGVAEDASVQFSQPVTSYLLDHDDSEGSEFLGFPVGLAVPVGSYNRATATWEGELNGVVIGIVSESGGLADVDTTGDGVADNGDGTVGLLSDAEREALATLFDPGDTVWRAAISHFTPIDLNHPISTPDDPRPPRIDPFDGAEDRTDNPFEETGYGAIEVEHQVLRETLALPGTGQALHYSSDRVPGRSRTLDLRVAGATLPDGLVRIEARATIAGKRYQETFDTPAPNQRWTVAWDGRDRFGASVQGQQPIVAVITYVYEGVYAIPAGQAIAFGLPSLDGPIDVDGGLVPVRIETTASSTYRSRLGGFDARAVGLGGWTMTDHHVYDPSSGVVHLGDGTRQGASVLGDAVLTVGGTGAECTDQGHECVLPGVPADETPMNPDQLTVAPDGTIYTIDSFRTAFAIAPDGTVSHLAGANSSDAATCEFYPDDVYPGSGRPQCATDGVDARTVLFDDPSDLALLPDGDVLIADEDDYRIYRVDPETHELTVLAGTGVRCTDDGAACGDGSPAVAAQLFGYDVYIAAGPDGSVYVSGDGTIRVITPTGTIQTLLGDPDVVCDTADCGNGGPAQAATTGAHGDMPLTVTADGSVYFADYDRDFNSYEIRRITPQGFVEYVALGAEWDDPNCSTWDNFDGIDCSGTPYDQVHIGGYVESIAVAADGSVYVSDIENMEIVRIWPGGVVDRVVGVGWLNSLASGAANVGTRQDGAPGPYTELVSATDIALGPDGSLFWVTGWWWGEDYRLRRLTPTSPAFDGGELAVPAQDGSEVWIFDENGRHLETRHGLTGATLRTFGYDAEGLLTTVTDGDGNVTTISRDGATAHPTAITGPFGQTTGIAVDDQGWLESATAPTGDVTTVTHTGSGLLTDVQGARASATYSFGYDAQGRLTSATDPGGTTTLAPTRLYPGSRVTVTSPEGRESVHTLRQTPTADVVRETTHPDGTSSETVRSDDGSVTHTSVAGVVTTTQFLPNPRLGPTAMYAAATTSTSPGGVERSSETAIDVTLDDPDDPFSLTEQTIEFTTNGRTSTATYDAASRSVMLSTAAGRQISGTIDAQGRPTSTRVGDLAPTAMEYDTHGRLCRATSSDGATTRETAYRYDLGAPICSDAGDGVPVEIIDGLGQVTGLVHDANLRPTEVTDAEGRTTTFGYDGSSNLVSLTPPEQPAHTQTFDARDNQTGYVPAGAATPAATWTYGPDGLAELLERADGSSNDPSYDDATGRLTSRTTDHATYGYEYDAAGRLSGLTSTVDANLTYGYDGNVLTSMTTTGPAATTRELTLDDDFRHATETIDAGTAAAHAVTYTYDDDGLVTGVGDLTIDRDPDTGLVIGTTLDDVTTTTTHNAFGDVATHSAAVGGVDIYAAAYDYDALGRIVTSTEDVEGVATTRTYQYDGVGRLTQVDEGLVTRTYGYDANGNRTAGPSGETGTYDDQDRLLTYGGRTYAHDAAGDLETITDGAGTRTFDYDADGALHGVQDSVGADVTYTADARGRRTSRTWSGGTMAWAYRDGVNPVAQYDGAGQRLLRFVFGTTSAAPDYLVDTSSGSASTHRVITDHTGSPRLVVNATTGAIVQRLDYDEFGVVTADSNPGYQPYGFQGGLYDPDTALVRFGARDYDATTGRFTTRDPILFSGAQANLYEFVTSDPVNFADRSGLGPGTSWLDAIRREAGYLRDGTKASGPQLVRATVGGAKVVGGLATTAAGVAAVETGIGAGPGVVMINMGLATTGSGAADIGAAVVEGPDVSTSAFPSTPITAAATNASPEVQALASAVELAVGGGVSRAAGGATNVVAESLETAGNVGTAIDTTNTAVSSVNSVLSE